MNTNRKPLSSRHLDMIAFLAVLAVLAIGTLLLLSGIPVSALATLATALSGLYSAWNTKRIPHTHTTRLRAPGSGLRKNGWRTGLK
ncbi:hypothetical protein ACH40F_39900 [Streptomyces sp. NPDC020794]|uniref:hypothetical protein n=1 Tax=unclassified Streptomyces TaxID=2593676 RepID=UPI0036E6533A